VDELIPIEGIRVAAGASEAEYRIKGSRFIAVARSISDLGHAVDLREKERRRFHDATHHVYAAILRGGDQRFDDDGEPSGTAGRPTLAAINCAGLYDVAVIVTRYFGGTKLGTGGLGRAYGTAADLALERMPVRTVVQGRRVLLTYSYADTGAVARSVDAIGATRLDERYGDVAELEVALPAVRVEALRAEVEEATAGRTELVELPGEMLLPFDT
jgi:uncharacterized YigZ family protein